jgi:polyisoprenoid-binding protein YceI
MKKSFYYTWMSAFLLAILVVGCASAAQSTPVVSKGSNSSPVSAPAANSASPNPSGSNSTNQESSPTPAAASSDRGPAAGAIQFTVTSGSFAQYRVREQLVGVSFPTDAIGKTTQITGSVTVNPDGSIDSAHSKIVANLSSLVSDRSMRDNFVSRNILNTSLYPNAVFVPTQISGLPSPLPQSGNVTFKLTGDLTVQNVTKPATWDVSGSINSNQASGTATTSFTFEDFNLNQPRVPVVLSIVDHITLEVTITLQRSGS